MREGAAILSRAENSGNAFYMNEPTMPLVSICTSTFNAERFVRRFLASSLNQTYPNIEVVIVDYGSSDGSEAILTEHASRDPRVRYFRRPYERPIAEKFAEAFQLARGEFVIIHGIDDWLARDYIANAVRGFSLHPDVAGIIPRFVSLLEISHNTFQFHDEHTFPSGVYSTGWFLRRLYRYCLSFTFYALVRRQDAIDAMEYFLRNYCNGMSVPPELRTLYVKGFAVDIEFFAKILTRYKCFIWDNSLTFIKIIHAHNVTYDLKPFSSFLGNIQYYYYLMLSYRYIYKPEWNRFYSGMKIRLGMEALATSVINFFRYNPHSSFFRVPGTKKQVSDFFWDFSVFEIAAVIALVIPRIVLRSFEFVIRRLTKRSTFAKEEVCEFTAANFLDANGRFNT